MRILLAACLSAATLAPATAASAQSPANYDYEAAGGAIAAGAMHGGAVDAIAGFCTSEVPDTARQWSGVVESWRVRNAPWVAAGEVVKRELFAGLRANGEDPADVEGAIQPMVQQFIEQTVGAMKARAENEGAGAVCTRMAGFIEAGGVDIQQNGFTRSVELLRKNLPSPSP